MDSYNGWELTELGIMYIRGSFHKYVTKHSISFPNIKNPKYIFCREFNSE